MNRRELIQLMIAAVMAPRDLVLVPQHIAAGERRSALFVRGLYASGHAKTSSLARVILMRDPLGEDILNFVFNASGGCIKWWPAPGDWPVFIPPHTPRLVLDNVNAVAGVWGQYEDGLAWGMSVGCDEEDVPMHRRLV